MNERTEPLLNSLWIGGELAHSTHWLPVVCGEGGAQDATVLLPTAIQPAGQHRNG
jgi:hypothetical protein